MHIQMPRLISACLCLLVVVDKLWIFMDGWTTNVVGCFLIVLDIGLMAGHGCVC